MTTIDDAGTYRSLLGAVLPLYRAGQYADALRLVRAAEPGLVPWRAETAHLAACLLSLEGDGHGAFEELRRGLNEGAWWERHLLEDDDDLTGAREVDGFAALVDEADARAQAGQGGGPAAVVERPETSPTSVVVALHGAGQDGADTVPLWRPLLEDGALLVAPTSSRRTTPTHRTWPDLLVGSHDVEQAIDEAQVPGDVPLVVGGFSAGGRQAMLMTLTANPDAPQRFLVVCPALSRIELDSGTAARAAARGVRGHVMLGADDEAVDAVTRAVTALNEAGVTTTLDVVDGLEHDYPDDFAARVRPAYAALLET